MFVHSRARTVEAFTPPALPGFIAIPASIPDHPSFCRPPCHRRIFILGTVQSGAKTGWPAWFVQVHNVLLDAVCDPGAVGNPSSLARLPLLPASITTSLARPNSPRYRGLLPDSASHASP